MKQNNHGKYMGAVNEAYNNQGDVHIRNISIILCVFVVLFLVWSFFSELDEIARGDGKVVPSGRTQMIQHLEGGILKSILVKEGDVVEEGQTLCMMQDSMTEASKRDKEQQIVRLTLEIARLEAEEKGKLPDFPVMYRNKYPVLVNNQTNLYWTKRHQLEEEVSVIESQMQQQKHELEEALNRETSLRSELEIAEERFLMVQKLYKQKNISKADFLSHQQDVTKMKGD